MAGRKVWVRPGQEGALLASTLSIQKARKTRHLGDTPYARFRRRYWRRPDLFILECLEWAEGEGPTFYQLENLRDLPLVVREAVRGPHGLGKTTQSAWLILWFALTRDGVDWKVVTTASAWRQLRRFLWPEVHKWARRIRWDRVGRSPFRSGTELLEMAIQLETGSAFAVASNNPALIEGAHADHLLYIYDESKEIPEGTWDASEGAFTGAGARDVEEDFFAELAGDRAVEVMAEREAYAFAVSTPGEPSGRFYEIHRRSPRYLDWTAKHVTLDDAIAAGRITREWSDARRTQWGETSAIFLNRVLGEFATGEKDTVIPLRWVELAVSRWQEWADWAEEQVGKVRPGTPVCVAADIGRGGDPSVLGRRKDYRPGSSRREADFQKDILALGELEYFGDADTMAVAGRVRAAMTAGGYAVIDVIGVGAGVYDRLREEGLEVYAFNAAERTQFRDRSGEFGFINTRAAAWWNLREMLDPDPARGQPIGLPPDDLLVGDLTAPTYAVRSGAMIQIESKDDIRKRLGRSTDSGDVAVEAFAPIERIYDGDVLVYHEPYVISDY